MKQTYKCLDKGYVKLIDVMGSDSAIVEAARISTNQSTKTPEADEALIRYLMRNAHTSPFEMCEIKLEIKLPIFIARQWVRHRTANINEISGRYTQLPSERYRPNINDLKQQSKINHQGSTDEIDEHLAFQMMDILDHAEYSFKDYEKLLSGGLSREMARINLPLSTYTKWIWKNDLHNTLKFLKLRLTEHAQPEIRVYAEAIAQIIKELFPITWRAFVDYELNSVKFSQKELEILEHVLDKKILIDVLNTYENRFGKSEFIEFKKKLNIFNER